VQIDHGPWFAARIGERRGRHAWVLWSHEVADLPAGLHTLVSRAIDSAGAVQPSQTEWSRAIRSARENNAQWERVIEIPG